MGKDVSDTVDTTSAATVDEATESAAEELHRRADAATVEAARWAHEKARASIRGFCPTEDHETTFAYFNRTTPSREQELSYFECEIELRGGCVLTKAVWPTVGRLAGETVVYMVADLTVEDVREAMETAAEDAIEADILMAKTQIKRIRATARVLDEAPTRRSGLRTA